MGVTLKPKYFIWKYQQFEMKLDDIQEYIPIIYEFDRPMFKFGSHKFCDYATDIGTFVDTLFNKIQTSDFLDEIEGFDKVNNAKRFNRPKIFREFLIDEFDLASAELFLDKECSIKPFEDMNKVYPSNLQQEDSWYPKYSRYKHNTEGLFNVWTYRDCFYSLGCAYLLTLFCLDVTLRAGNLKTKSLTRYFIVTPMDFYYGPTGWIFKANQYRSKMQKNNK